MNPLHIRQHLIPDMRTRVKKKFKVYSWEMCLCRYYKYPKCGILKYIIDLLYGTYERRDGCKRAENPLKKIFWANKRKRD